MTTYYNINDKIKVHLLADVSCNTVSKGSLHDIDTANKTLFPLSHIMVNNVSYQGNVLVYNVSVLSMDIVPEHNGVNADMMLDSIMNTQLSVQVNLLESIRRGDLFDSQLELDNDSVLLEPWEDRFENALAGWTSTFDMVVANTASIC